MKIQIGQGLQGLGQRLQDISNVGMDIAFAKQERDLVANENLYKVNAQRAQLDMERQIQGLLQDANTRLYEPGTDIDGLPDELSGKVQEYYDDNVTTWFRTEEERQRFATETLEPLVGKLHYDVTDSLFTAKNKLAFDTASQNIDDTLASLKDGTNPEAVWNKAVEQLSVQFSTGLMTPVERNVKVQDITKTFNTAVATNGIQRLIASGISEDKVLSAVDALSSGKETETTKAIFASMMGNLDSESAEEMKKNVIKLNDDIQKSRMDTINGAIYGAKHSGKLFDTTSIDELIEKVPTRHKVDLYKAKETATVYNDGVYEEVLERGLSSGKPVGDDWWDVLDLVSTSSIKSNLARQALTSLAESQPSKEAAYAAIHSSRASLADKRTVAAKYVVDNVKSDELTYEDMVQTMFALQNGQQILPQLSTSFDPETITVKDIEKDISSGFITGKQEKVSIPTESGMVEIPAMDEVDIPKEYEQAVAEEVIKQIGFELPPLQHHGIKSSVLPKASFSMNAVEQPTIDASALPTVENEEGTVSTVDTISIEEDGKEVLIPTIVEGERVSDEEAVTHYKETNEHFGKYNSVDEANEAAEKLHESEEQRVQAPPMDAPSSMNAVEQPTIDASALPTVENEEGTVSTVDTISIEEDGKEVLIPTIVEGERVSDEEAVTHYKETNEHFGKYNSVDEANEAAEKLHESEEQRVQAPPMDAPSSMNAVAEEDAVVEDAVDRTKAQEYAKQLVERYRMLLSTADAVGQLKSDVERIKAKKTKFQKETVEVPEEEDTVETKSYDQGYRTPIGTTVTDTPSDTADKQYLNGMAAATFITMKEPGLTPEKKFMSVNPNSTQKEIADAIVYNAVNGMAPSTQDFMLLDPDGREIVRDSVQQVFRGEPVMSDHTVLNQVIQLWKDNTIPEASLKEFVELSYRFGNLTKDDADMYGSRPTWMANGRFSDLDAIIKKKTEWLDIVDQIHIKNEIYRDVVENPSSMADDRQFQSYTEQVGAMVGESSAKKYLKGIETISKAMDDPDSIKALTSKHVSTFAIEARDGKYDLAIDMSLQDGPLKVFGGTFDQMVDYISKEMYGKSYDDIKNDTDGESVYFRQSRVMANAMFKQLGNVQMETFSRYMGFSPKSLQRVGNTWAFEDPAVKGLFYRMGNFASEGGSGGVRWEVFTMEKKNGAYDPSTIGNIAYIPEVMVDIEKELPLAESTLEMVKGMKRSQEDSLNKWWLTPVPSTGGIQMRPDFTKDIRDAQQVVDDLEKKKHVRDQFILGVREQLLKNNR